MKAVGNIQRITKTMQMIATARFQAMQKKGTQARAYTERIAGIVGELAASLGPESPVRHPLLSSPEPAVGRELLLVLTSNRGLCGGYNANVLRTAIRFLDEADAQIDLEVVGKKGLGYFRFNGVPIEAYHDQFTDTPAYEPVEQLAQRYMDEFTLGRYDAVRVCYMAFETMSRQTPRVIRLLPLERPETEADQPRGQVQYDFSPSPEQLLGQILPITVKTQLFQCFNEAVVSEQIARMVAMKAATDAAGRMKKDLSREFNRARQTAITTELSEIIGGAAALA